MNYDFAAIEKKWQANWEKNEALRGHYRRQAAQVLRAIEFPYPSGQGCTWAIPGPLRPWTS